MDKIKENERAKAFDKKKQEILDLSENMQVKEVFATSIWDETLYKVIIIYWYKLIKIIFYLNLVRPGRKSCNF